MLLEIRNSGQRLCPGDQLPPSHRGGSVSIPGQSLWGLCSIKCHFSFPPVIVVSLTVSTHRRLNTTLIRRTTRWGGIGGTGQPPNRGSALADIGGGALGRKVLSRGLNVLQRVNKVSTKGLQLKFDSSVLIKVTLVGCYFQIVLCCQLKI